MFDQMQNPEIMKQKLAQLQDPQKRMQAAFKAAQQFGPPPELPTDASGMAPPINPAMHQPAGQQQPQAPMPPAQAAPPPQGMIPPPAIEGPARSTAGGMDAAQAAYMKFIGA